MKNLSLIVAVAQNGVIGNRGKLPWHLPTDLRRFKERTEGHVVVCGRATHDAIVRYLGHPLSNRETMVVSSSLREDEYSSSHAVWWERSPEDALRVVTKDIAVEREVFVIGGAQIYQALLPEVSRLYVTVVEAAVRGDTRIDPGWLSEFRKAFRGPTINDGTYPYHFAQWTRSR